MLASWAVPIDFSLVEHSYHPVGPTQTGKRNEVNSIGNTWSKAETWSATNQGSESGSSLTSAGKDHHHSEPHVLISASFLRGMSRSTGCNDVRYCLAHYLEDSKSPGHSSCYWQETKTKMLLGVVASGPSRWCPGYAGLTARFHFAFQEHVLKPAHSLTLFVSFHAKKPCLPDVYSGVIWNFISQIFLSFLSLSFQAVAFCLPELLAWESCLSSGKKCNCMFLLVLMSPREIFSRREEIINEVYCKINTLDEQ